VIWKPPANLRASWPVAALYVDKVGPYVDLVANGEWYDIDRGARTYAAAHLKDTECREFTGATLARVVPSTVADATAGKSYLAAVAVEHRIGFRA